MNIALIVIMVLFLGAIAFMVYMEVSTSRLQTRAVEETIERRRRAGTLGRQF